MSYIHSLARFTSDECITEFISYTHEYAAIFESCQTIIFIRTRFKRNLPFESYQNVELYQKFVESTELNCYASHFTFCFTRFKRDPSV